MPTSNVPAGNVQRAPGAVTAASASRTPQQSRAAKRHRRRMMLCLAVALLRDRRFRENAIVGIVILAGLAQLARESGTRAQGRLVAWLDAAPAPDDRAPAYKRRAIDRAA